MDKTKATVSHQLEELGYFQYVSTEDKAKVIEKTFEHYKEDGVIKFPWEGLNRIFDIDGEDIYEAGGLKKQIEGILPTFRAMGIDLKIGEYVEEFNNDNETYTKRTIQLNEKVYDVSGVNGWGAAAVSGFRLIDEILNDYGKKERAFLLFADQNTIFIILDDEQYKYLHALVPKNADFRPRDLRAELDKDKKTN